MKSIRNLVEDAMEGIGRRDPDPFVNMLADDAIMEILFSPSGPAPRFVGKAAIAQVMEGIRHVQEMTNEPYRLYVDDAAQVVTVEASTIIQDTADAPPLRHRQAAIVEFRDGLAVAWRAYRSAMPLTSGDP